MKDSEIGELWKYLWNDEPVHEVSPYTVVKLIRKLIEERAGRYRNEGCQGWTCLALRDFGIDPKEFSAHVTPPEGSQDTLKSVSGSDKDE